MQPTVRRYRLLRGLVRAVSVAVPGRRKAVVERLLRAAFGDIVEASGHLLEVDPADRLLGARLRRRGVWSKAETKLYERCLRPGNVVVDCGAHVGYFTLIFARSVGPTGQVLAFEPEPRSFRLLERNVRRNGYDNVATIQEALSRDRGQAPLSVATGNLGDHRLGRRLAGRETITVRTTTLDAHLARSARPPDFLKLDVQGSEAAVLDGAREILSSSPRMAMLTEFWPAAIREAGDDPELFLEQLVASGFSIAVLAGSGRLSAVATAADRSRLCDDATDLNLFCWKGRSPLEPQTAGRMVD